MVRHVLKLGKDLGFAAVIQRVNTGSALNPLLFLTAGSFISTLAAAALDGSLMWFFAVVSGVCVAMVARAYDFFMKNDPNRRQAEKLHQDTLNERLLLDERTKSNGAVIDPTPIANTHSEQASDESGRIDETHYKVYAINFTLREMAQLTAIEHWLQFDEAILGYWNYIPLTYFIKSPLPAAELSKRLWHLFPGGGYAVAELNRANIDGQLPSAAWDWLHAVPEQRLPTAFLTGAFGRLVRARSS